MTHRGINQLCDHYYSCKRIHQHGLLRKMSLIMLLTVRVRFYKMQIDTLFPTNAQLEIYCKPFFNFAPKKIVTRTY